jgi:hypothetical protein|tara:strand:+ start:17355 stop:18962 length:1608 start_codon:yes stop_codon:yes gene_type:complete
MSVRNYNLPDSIPFTTAESDFQKLLQSGEKFKNKKDLIDYAGTDFGDLRQNLITYLQAVYPEDYQNISESDFGIMFTELVSYMGAVLSFKADALANENFLSTAKNRNNVKKLLELIGIRMKGPTSAGGNARVVLLSPAGSNPVITAQNRVVTLTSPQDGGQVTYTLYPVESGKISALATNTTDITLALSDSESGANASWTNLALVEGSLVDETGSFDSTEVFKKITLTQGPVIENSVQVFVTAEDAASGVYTQVDNIFSSSGATDRIFDTVYDDEYNATLRFGDGAVGASPPNSSTYRVVYRIGGGTRGNLIGATIASPITTSVGPGTLSNTSVITGGIDAETVENVKRNGPLVFKQQDRLVTLGDYSSHVSRYVSPTGGASIGTASTRKAYSSANIIDVYVLQKATATQLQRATVDYKSNLLNSIEQKKMLTDEVVVADGLIRTLDLSLTLYVDSALKDSEDIIKQKAASVVTSFFTYDKFGFGETFIPQELNRKLFDLNEVRYSTVDNFTKNVTVSFNEVIQLNNATINVAYI